MENIKKVALLIDTDNISDKHAEQIYKYAAAKGNVIVRRGYGVLKFQWGKEEMLRYAIDPIVKFVNVSGKNVTDIALVIDALDLVYKQIVDVICIASNDSDFSPLAMKIRELGIDVYGVGTAGAQKSFKASCDDFLTLPSAPPQSKDSEKSKEKPENANAQNVAKIRNIAKAKNILKDACSHCEDADGWATIVAVSNYIKRIYPDFSPKDYGPVRFSTLIKATEIFDYDDSEKTVHKIRIKENSN